MGYPEGFAVTFKKWGEGVTTREYRAGRKGRGGEISTKDQKAPKPERAHGRHVLNRYEDGSDYMGWHRDDEAELSGPVASVSLGARRRFLLRENDAPRSQRLDLEHGSLLVFEGSLHHSLPRCARSGPRLNLTFRCISAGSA